MNDRSDQLTRGNQTPLVQPGGIEHFAPDMTVIVAADVPLSKLERELARADQWLPIDAEDADTPVGDLVQRNSTGPLRLGYGAWRDLLLGCQFTNGQGELITAGGRTVKNVAGYDLTKFMVGQHGVFGKLVTITTRVYRRPESFLIARFEPEARKLGSLLTSSCRPQWAVLRKGELRCGYMGSRRTIEFIESSLSPFGPLEIHHSSSYESPKLAGHSGAARFRAIVLPSKIENFVAAAGPLDWWADPAFGLVCGIATDSRLVECAIAEVGGSVLFFDASGSPSRIRLSEGEQKLLRNLKSAFDPDAKLPLLPLT